MTRTVKLLFIFISIICFYSCNSNTNSNEEIESEFLEIQPYDEVVTDIDGNKYETIKIGNNIWFASNLKVTRFSNGDKIPNIKEDEAWKKNIGPSYCVFNNDMKNFDFGFLYDFYAIIDKRNICPTGWHVPSFDEWGHNSTSFNPNDKLFNNKILGWRRISDDVDYFVNGDLNKDPNFNSFQDETRFEGEGSAIYWTSDQFFDADYSTENPIDSAVVGQTYITGNFGEYGFGYRKDGYLCRCIKNSIKD